MGEHVEEIDKYFFQMLALSILKYNQGSIRAAHILRMIMTPNDIAPNLFQDLNIFIACLFVYY